MNCDFSYNLINPNKSSIRLLANSILILNGLILVFVAYHQHASKYHFIRTGLIILLAILDLYFRRKDWLYHTGGIVLVFIGWLFLGYWWIGIIMIGLSVFAEFASVDKRICFEKSLISTTTIFGRTYQWKDLQNVVLKDGLLTLDFKNNRILQLYIKNSVTKDTEQVFNDYCKQFLSI